MEHRARFIMFLAGLVVFFVLAPVIVLYSVGYRIDFEQKKFVATGGIYIKARPQGVSVFLENKTKYKTGLFSDAVLIKNLLPKKHTLTVAQEGYYPYQKEIEVNEKEVAKLEHIILFKKDITFRQIAKESDYFFLTPSGEKIISFQKGGAARAIISLIDLSNLQITKVNLPVLSSNEKPELLWQDGSQTALLKTGSYYFILRDEGQNNYSSQNLVTLRFSKKAVFQDSQKILFLKNGRLNQLDIENSFQVPFLDRVIDFAVNGQKIIWLGQDGFFYESPIGQELLEPKVLSEGKFTLKTGASYQLFNFSGNIFLKENQTLYRFNLKTKKADVVYESVNNSNLSPDGRNLTIYNNGEILIYNLEGKRSQIEFLNRFSEKISNLFWINDNYLIFNLGEKIIISETHNEGGVNTIELPHRISFRESKVAEIKNPKIIYGQTNGKLYILSEGNIFESEKLITD